MVLRHSHLQAYADRVRMATKSETVECWEAVADAALLAWRRRHREARHAEVRAGRQRARVLARAGAAHVQVQERRAPPLRLRRDQRRPKRRDAVALHALSRRHLFRRNIGPLRTSSAPIRIRRHRRLSHHGQFRFRFDRYDRPHRRSGHILRLVYVRDEAPYVDIFVITGLGERKARRTGHDVSPSIIRRVFTASCDKCVRVVTGPRYDEHAWRGRGRSLFASQRGAGRAARGGLPRWMNANAYVLRSRCCKCVRRAAWWSRRRCDAPSARGATCRAAAGSTVRDRRPSRAGQRSPPPN